MKTFKEVIQKQLSIVNDFLLKIERIESSNPKRKNMQDQYKLELPGGSVEILANSDLEAMRAADRHLAANRIEFRGLKLFRYPKEYVNRTVPLIEVFEFRTRDKWTRNLNLI